MVLCDLEGASVSSVLSRFRILENGDRDLPDGALWPGVGCICVLGSF